MSFTRQASGRLLRRGIEGWPHCPPAFWTVTLWRLSTHTYTWSKLKPLWPTAQAQYDPLFQHQHNFCGLKHKRVSPAASLPVPNLLKGAPALSHHLESSRQSLCTWRPALYAPGALLLSPAWLFLHLVLCSLPGKLLFMHLVLCSFRLLGSFCTWFSSWNTSTGFSSCSFFPLWVRYISRLFVHFIKDSRCLVWNVSCKLYKDFKETALAAWFPFWDLLTDFYCRLEDRRQAFSFPG